jgi:hypothetical protein
VRNKEVSNKEAHQQLIPRARLRAVCDAVCVCSPYLPSLTGERL